MRDTIRLAALVMILWPLAAADAQTQARFGTRPPRTCAKVTAEPDLDQIKALIQCEYEDLSRDYVTLIENISVETGRARAYNYNQDSYKSNIDTDASVLPLRGSADKYQCARISKPGPVPSVYDVDNTGKNCMVVPMRRAEGGCYRTTFGDWRCVFMETTDPSNFVHDQPPPG